MEQQSNLQVGLSAAYLMYAKHGANKGYLKIFR